MEWLLEEAFISSIPAEAFRTWDGRSEFLAELIERANTLREASARRPYWLQRASQQAAAPQVLTMNDAKWRFATIVADFDRKGYLANVFHPNAGQSHM